VLADALVDRARARLQQPAFAAVAVRLRVELPEDLARPLRIPSPDQPAGYYHDYFCPQHGVQLEFEWDSPRAHRCPVDGASFGGEPYDRAWWWFVNHAHSEAGFRLALGWRLMDDRAGLDRLRAILEAYAAHYPEAGWPRDDPRPRQGKVTYHALDEAVWLIPLAWAYHLVRGALPAEAQHNVEARLLLPAAEHLLRQRWQQVHNYMCWLNAGVAAAAALVGRHDLVAQVIDGPYGFRQQVAEGVLEDGTWWEGSASYHFYTLAAVLAMVRSVEEPPRGPGRAEPLQRHPKVRRMFRAPLRWAYPDLSLPAINDCWYHSSLVGEVGHGIPPAASFYEVAAGWYGDPAFRTILAANYQGGRQRDSLEALLFGPDDIPASDGRRPRLLTASADLPDFGVAVLRGPAASRSDREPGGDDRRTFLLLKYGRHGGGHGHPDKLGIILAGGARLSPDLGTPGYGIALNETWYRHTLSHNTVLLDGQPQPPATGRLLAFSAPRWRDEGAQGKDDNGEPFGLIDAAVEWPADAHDAVLGAFRSARRARETPLGVYDGVKLRRLILFRPHYVVDVFAVSCPQEQTIDWAYHNLRELREIGPLPGSWPAAPARDAGSPPAVPEPLRPRHTIPGEHDVLVAFATGAAQLDVWLRGMPAASVLVADAPANPASETMTLILRRCRAAQAIFAAVFHPYLGQPAISAVSWSQTSSLLRCEIRLRRGSERWEIPLPQDDRPTQPRLQRWTGTADAR
jgi:hypothetical protein